MDAAAVSAMLAGEIPDEPPEGFLPIQVGTGFNVYFGPIYGKLIDGKLRLGLRIGRRHINPHDTCHGGVIASFADMQVYVSQHQEQALRRMLLPTISLNVDFISPAALGDWLEGHSILLRHTNSTLFQQTIGMAGDRVVFRASCIYKVSGREAPEGSWVGDAFVSQ
ncbi:MAG: PaaI family thioesterase [Mesorhizobium sp.]|nr:PaaI family thioesterase [Mesorhizobium sp.]MCO5161347.1 PaaI family thioesterase [Mesorhizobium sp.]